MGEAITLHSIGAGSQAGTEAIGADRPPDSQPNGAECENTPPRFVLSDRQIEVLSWAARGLLDREIGEAIGLAPQTVRHHLQTTRTKLKARNTTHAVAIALTENLITLEDRS